MTSKISFNVQKNGPKKNLQRAQLGAKSNRSLPFYIIYADNKYKQRRRQSNLTECLEEWVSLLANKHKSRYQLFNENSNLLHQTNKFLRFLHPPQASHTKTTTRGTSECQKTARIVACANRDTLRAYNGTLPCH